jgi:hypothetical protein
LDESFSLGNAHASMAMPSFITILFVHEVLVHALTFIIMV